MNLTFNVLMDEIIFLYKTRQDRPQATVIKVQYRDIFGSCVTLLRNVDCDVCLGILPLLFPQR